MNFVVVASCQRALPLPESVALPPPSVGARVWGWGRKQDRKGAPERARAGDVPMSLIWESRCACVLPAGEMLGHRPLGLFGPSSGVENQ